MIEILDIILFILPAYIANSSPVVLGGGKPLDLGLNFLDDKRIFGDSKTIRGFIGGVASGIIFAFLLGNLILPYGFDLRSYLIVATLLSFGTLVGDALGSFIKRRLNVGGGKPFLLDQVSFLIIALIFAYPTSPLEYFEIFPLVFLFVLTYLAHVGSNYFANKIGIKKVPW